MLQLNWARLPDARFFVPKTLEQRFREKISPVRNEEADCWHWKAFKDRSGYGGFVIDGKTRRAHRVAYEWWCSLIPEGLVIDHICGQRDCVNPNHLQAVSRAENTRRGDGGKIWRERSHCSMGHEFTEENTFHRSDGGRGCRVCRKERNRRYHANKIKNRQVSSEDPFWGKLNKPNGPSGCWIWTETKNDLGYGRTMVKNRQVFAHRRAYELAVGPIPAGLVIDHLCKNPPCCNPSHLEAVTPTENTRRGERRKTHCKSGRHLFSEENTIYEPKGRRCRECLREWDGWQGGVHNRLKTHCPKGHEYTPENTYLNPGTGGRHCRTCTRDRRKKPD